ncbi:hypothetical protein [Ewingella americana]|uniref:Uncharacterized protein n=1 Tax=Ewingella americana TaxID=41202 RepID=A0A502GEH1_9GAMM|nr:hypothetical protein [Ewingella americana]TPG59938.1 hypothetical protein EAH77_15335 [Ewingella americana]
MAADSEEIAFNKQITIYLKEGNQIMQNLKSLSPAKRDEYISLTESTDPKAMSLPHPVIAKNYCQTETALVCQFDPTGYAIIRKDIDSRMSIGVTENDLATFNKKAFNNILGAEACANAGALTLMLFPVYFFHGNGALVTVRPGTLSDLQETDLGKDIPSTFFYAPFPTTYLHLDDANLSLPHIVNNEVSGIHKLVGIYVIETSASHIVAPNEQVKSKIQYLGLDANKPVRILDIMFVGKPKAHISDDATYTITLYMQDEREYTMGEVINRHIQYYSEKVINPNYPTRDMSDVEAGTFAQNLDLLAKILLFINCEREDGHKFVQKKDLTEFNKKFAGLGQKKQAKLAGKNRNLYDTIIIGSQTSVIHEAKTQMGSGDPKTSRKAHWRRGHFRNQRYGEGNSKVKVILIKAALIGMSSLTDEKPQVKKYEV